MSPHSEAVLRDPEQLVAFLSQVLGQPIAGLHSLPPGWNTRILGFQAGQQALILRISTHADSVRKEALAHRLFGQALPVPRVWCEGRRGRLFWAVVSRCAGRDLAQWPLSQQLALGPQIFALHTQLLQQALPLRGAENRCGLAPGFQTQSWRARLFALKDMREALAALADPQAWLSPQRLQVLLQLFETHLEACPDRPCWWVQGDFKAANVLASADGVSGWIDWSGLKVGDFLYDTALWLWHQPFPRWESWLRLCLAAYRPLELPLEAAEARLQAYCLHTALGSLVRLAEIPALQGYRAFYEAQLEALLGGALEAAWRRSL